MKIVLAPNAFKGSLSAREAAQAMSLGASRAFPGATLVELPVADGGDGLIDVAAAAMAGEVRTAQVSGPLGQTVAASWFIAKDGELAVIETALASGLALLGESQRDALSASTRGTGELIAAALAAGARHIAVGLGGSASTDGGTGAAAALGVRFLDSTDRALEPCGGTLADIARIDVSGRDSRLADVRVDAICDVDNPLHGAQGAAQVFGPQKGAAPEQVTRLVRGLANLAQRLQQDIDCDVAALPGAGAAGGLGAGLFAFCGASLRRGSDWVLELTRFPVHLEAADLVLTGEGYLDGQTLRGKAPAAVATAARAHGVPCIAIAGGMDAGFRSGGSALFAAAYELGDDSVATSRRIREARERLSDVTERALRRHFAPPGGG